MISSNNLLKKVIKMRVLAIDVAVNGCSVAILDTETGIAHQKRLETDRGQAEALIPMVDEVAHMADIILKDLNMIVVTRGPGSFTGVRIGLATAKSLGLALNIPVIGISTLDAIARSQKSANDTLFLIDTKRDDFYGQVGEGSEPKIWNNDEIENYKGPVVKDAIPDIIILAQMGAELYAGQTEYTLGEAPQPLYLRGAEVSESKKKTLTILHE